MRLAKFLAHSGVASRRAAERLVAEGRGALAGGGGRDPAPDLRGPAPVAVAGRPVAPPAGRVVYAVNKPAGVVSTARDTHGRPTVVELVPAERRLYPVARLDADTTGLILLTDDGELANRLTHPRYGVPRTYRARVLGGPVPSRALHALRRGVELDDGPTAPAQVRLLRPDVLEITIREGRKRHARPMGEAVGHLVSALERTALGPLRLGRLKPGSHRRLDD